MNIVEVLLLVAAGGAAIYRLGRWAIRRADEQAEERAAKAHAMSFCGNCGEYIQVPTYGQDVQVKGQWYHAKCWQELLGEVNTKRRGS